MSILVESMTYSGVAEYNAANPAATAPQPRTELWGAGTLTKDYDDANEAVYVVCNGRAAVGDEVGNLIRTTLGGIGGPVTLLATDVTSNDLDSLPRMLGTERELLSALADRLKRRTS